MKTRTRKLILDRINNYIEKKDACLVWNGATDSRGHPKIYSDVNKAGNPVSRSVLRYLWAKYKGYSPGNLYNTCGNLKCVLVDHYRPAIISHFKKISNEQVLEIRELWRLSQLHSTSMPKLARKYGVTKQSIEHIVNNKTRTKAARIIANEEYLVTSTTNQRNKNEANI